MLEHSSHAASVDTQDAHIVFSRLDSKHGNGLLAWLDLQLHHQRPREGEAENAQSRRTGCGEGLSQRPSFPGARAAMSLVRRTRDSSLRRQHPKVQLDEGGNFAFEYGDMAMLHYSRSQRIEQLEGLSR